MLSRKCPFCENANPPNARFCNACGVKLQAALCPHCGAVNVVSATVCVQCAEPLESPADAQSAAQSEPAYRGPAAAHAPPQQASDALAIQPVRATVEPELPVAFWVHFDQDHTAKIDRYDLDAVRLGLSAGVAAAPNLPALTAAAAAAPQPALNGWTAHDTEAIARSVASTAAHEGKLPAASLPSQTPRYAALIASVVLAVFAGLTYFLYREHSKVNTAAVVYAGGESTPANASSDADPAAQPAEAKSVDANSAPARDAKESAAVSPSQAGAFPPLPPTPVANARATIDQPAVIRPQIGSKEAAAAVAAAAARPKPAVASSDRQPQRIEPCTDAVSALGLCATASTTSARH